MPNDIHKLSDLYLDRHVNYVTYYIFKSYFANTKLYLIVIYPHAFCLNTCLKEKYSRYAFKQMHLYDVSYI